jgi:hypothetical protein
VLEEGACSGCIFYFSYGPWEGFDFFEWMQTYYFFNFILYCHGTKMGTALSLGIGHGNWKMK